MNIKLKILLFFKPLIWRLAEFYDIQVNKPYFPHGANKVLIEDDEIQRTHNIPKSVYFNTASGNISIGSGTQFGERVQLLTGMHLHETQAKKLDVPLHSVPPNGRDIVIGKNCYIGGNAIIIGPVNIGDGAVIAAGAIVTKDIPSNAFATCPSATVKKIFE